MHISNKKQSPSHHSPVTEAENVCEILDCCYVLMHLVTREDFIAVDVLFVKLRKLCGDKIQKEEQLMLCSFKEAYIKFI
jgi:hypothetical protein